MPLPEAGEFEITLPGAGQTVTRAGARKTSLATRVRWAVVGLFVAGAGAILVAAAWQPGRTRSNTVLVIPDPLPPKVHPTKLNSPKANQPQGEAKSATQFKGSEQRTTDKLKPESPTASARSPKLSEMLARIESGIVKIESGGPLGRNNLGSGFVLDARGLVATNLHVIDEATEGQVRLKNGAAYEIAGYAAVEPDFDLAILRLKDPPPNLTPLTLRANDDPPQLSPVIAIGHPLGVDFSPFDGKVSRVLLTRELPSASQQFLTRHLNAQVDLRWIQHTAHISVGNSGGPLLDDRGDVLGVNTWVDRESKFAYALHARYVARLLGRLLDETAPLERYASKEARLNAAVARLSSDRLRRLYDDCQALRWRPASMAEYETLQQLAWAITYPKFSGNLGGANMLDGPMLDALAKTADQIEARLKKQKSDAFGQITLINEFAVEQVNRPLAGQFFFGTVERIVEGEAGSRGMLMKLAGFEQMLFLPLDGSLFTAPPGTHCLVLGVNANGHVVRYGENPLRLISAPVIVSGTILPLDE